MTEFIHSERLELRPMTPDFLVASLNGDRLAAAQWLGASVPRDWPDIPEVLSMGFSSFAKIQCCDLGCYAQCVIAKKERW